MGPPTQLKKLFLGSSSVRRRGIKLFGVKLSCFWGVFRYFLCSSHHRNQGIRPSNGHWKPFLMTLGPSYQRKGVITTFCHFVGPTLSIRGGIRWWHSFFFLCQFSTLGENFSIFLQKYKKHALPLCGLHPVHTGADKVVTSNTTHLLEKTNFFPIFPLFKENPPQNGNTGSIHVHIHT